MLVDRKNVTVAVHSSPVFVVLLTFAVSNLRAQETVDFARDVRPILSDACFKCHGVDEAKRKARLRLDLDLAKTVGASESALVVPGKPERSELYRRIHSSDPKEQMPPADAVRQLSSKERGIIRRWIEEGARWKQHWSFVPVVRPEPPTSSDPQWARGSIDRFVRAKLDEMGWKPAAETQPERLLRRVTLDLTGLPPTLSELDRFLSDGSPNAYERAVDRLLSSSRYGEQMAQTWLDLARYADTDGYQDDEPRNMWRWREWLIDSLNADLPFDDFTVHQIAGDLLPGASPEQTLATGFLRNNRVNGEGGSIAEEFRVEYIVDRVETVSSVWLGLTTGCARCHDHKYDPISQRDFYSFFAFFNQTKEPGTYRRSADPAIRVPSRLAMSELRSIESEIERAPKGSKRLSDLNARRKRLQESAPSTMVMTDSQSRDTFVLVRGLYDQRGEKVTANVPKSLPALAEKAPRNRLGLAQWLVDAKHPLTARVAVNRLWQLHFGSGLVRTSEDFGSQGEPPSHPLLLDWLASELVRLDWSVKEIQRAIVSSSTYRQAARGSATVHEVDPNNRWLARGPQGRLSAETIRDQALFLGGLLVERSGGPSVKPYQPAKMWLEVTGVTTNAYKNGYVQDKGANLYRRSLYTFWRRAIPPPALSIFDAPTREVCVSRRERTSSPLQALVLMNDVTYVEAARGLATRMLREGGETTEGRLIHGFRLALSREPNQAELAVIGDALRRHLDSFQDEKAASAFAHVGSSKPVGALDVRTLAAYTAIASTLLNLGEAIRR
ncbi:MAG: PSD1 and planctomycete cytochrome C domain-containing protein [Planctomycetota bacterium]